jgi:hypothetical protein
MEVTVRVDAEHLGDELRSLREWMIADAELRGRVHLTVRPPEPGKLGAVSDSLTVALGSGGAVTATATAVSTVLITWIRRRAGTITVKLTRPDGASVEYHAENIRGLSAAEINAATTKLADYLSKSADQ